MSLGKILNREEFKSVTDAFLHIHEAVSHQKRVTENNHLHYKYPAGFSPTFPNAVIRSFTSENSLILDPFMGGGTTAVEALRLNRNVIGIDRNELAVFTAKLKLIQLTLTSLANLDEWMESLEAGLHDYSSMEEVKEDDSEYFANLPGLIKKPINHAVKSIKVLKNHDEETFARGVILRTSQILLDNKRHSPTPKQFREKLVETYEFMVEQSVAAFRHTGVKRVAVKNFFDIRVGCSSCPKLYSQLVSKKQRKVDLVLTSPPYPGVHILYNRWQINGRRESTIPYFIIGSNQKKTSSYFTMGYWASQKGLVDYYDNIREVYSNVGNVIERGTPVVQMVAFSKKDEQLEMFLDAMSDSGFKEIRASKALKLDNGRIWREVPNRKWYNSLGNNSSNSSNEVVLVHTKK